MCTMWQTVPGDGLTDKVYTHTKQKLFELDQLTPDSIPPKEQLARLAKLAELSRMSEGKRNLSSQNGMDEGACRGRAASPHSRTREGKRGASGAARQDGRTEVPISGSRKMVTLVDGQRVHASADTRPIPPPGMEFEVNRLATFAGWPHSAPVSANALARAGFYFTQTGDQVQCFACLGVVEAWEYGDTAMGEHKKHFPRCPFVRDPSHRNKPLMLEHDATSNLKKVAANLNERQKGPQVLSGKAEGGKTPSNKELSESELTFRSEYKRVLSFRDWPQRSPVEPLDLAKAGFHYMSKDDFVQCFACFGKVAGWEPGDVPLQEHRRHYPSCPFVLGLETHNQPMTALQASRAAPIIFRQPMASPRTGRPSGTALPQTARVVGEWEPAPAPNVLGDPRYPQYSGENARVETYNTPNWPGILGITPKQLARAGFFFTGEEDHTKCFFCGGGLMHWESTDEPWTEHAKWFPICDWLRQQRGQTFVSYVVRNFPVKSSQLPSGKSRNTTAATGTVQKPTMPPAAKSPAKQRPEDEAGIVIQKKAPPKHSPIDKAMSSRLTKFVLEMGYREALVKRVVQSRLQETGNEFQSTDDLLEAIFKAEEEEEEEEEEEQAPTISEAQGGGLDNSKNRPAGQEGASRQRAASDEVTALSKELANLRTSDPSPTTKKDEGPVVKDVKTAQHQTPIEPNEEVLREVERLRDERLCKVCLDKEADIVLMPCTHLVLCSACANSLTSCPICRQTITQAVKVFKS